MRVWKEEDVLRLLRKHRAPQYLCFPSAVLMDRMAYNKDGGIFAGFFSGSFVWAYQQRSPYMQLPYPLRRGRTITFSQ